MCQGGHAAAMGWGSVVRCTAVSKPEVGSVHFHARWWRPGRVVSVWFQPVGSVMLHRVAPGAQQSLLEVGSVEQAMALVRSEPVVSVVSSCGVEG